MKVSREKVISTRRCPKRQCGCSKKRCGEPLRFVNIGRQLLLKCDFEGCGFRMRGSKGDIMKWSIDPEREQTSGEEHFFPELDEFFDGPPPPQALVFHPAPVPCRACGVILQATYAADNGFRCPGCQRPACYTCGCTPDRACCVTRTTLDGSRSQEYFCWWAEPGVCGFCFARAAYELYMETTGRPATDPFYMNLGRSAFTFKGLDYGIGAPIDRRIT